MGKEFAVKAGRPEFGSLAACGGWSGVGGGGGGGKPGVVEYLVIPVLRNRHRRSPRLVGWLV